MSIKSDLIKVKGKLSFMHFIRPDQYNERSAPKYTFTLTNLSDAAVKAITDRFGEDAGLGHKRIKFNEKYPEAGQTTKFSSAYPIKVVYEGRDLVTQGKDAAGNAFAIVNDPLAESIGYGSTAVVTVAADKNGNPRAAKVEIVELVEFEPEEDDDDVEVL